MKLLVLRHTETEYNTLRLMQGTIDTFPTKKGMENCLKVKEILKDYAIDFTLTSPLIRAKITASMVTDTPILVEERLIERNLGIYEGRNSGTYDYKKYANYTINEMKDGVEGIRELYNRVKSLIDDLRVYKDKTILLVTHGGLMKVIPYCINGIPEDGVLESTTVDNLEFLEYNI